MVNVARSYRLLASMHAAATIHSSIDFYDVHFGLWHGCSRGDYTDTSRFVVNSGCTSCDMLLSMCRRSLWLTLQPVGRCLLSLAHWSANINSPGTSLTCSSVLQWQLSCRCALSISKGYTFSCPSSAFTNTGSMQRKAIHEDTNPVTWKWKYVIFAFAKPPKPLPKLFPQAAEAQTFLQVLWSIAFSLTCARPMTGVEPQLPDFAAGAAEQRIAVASAAAAATAARHDVPHIEWGCP